MNLLIKDILGIDEYKSILDDAVFVAKTILGSQNIKAAFDTMRDAANTVSVNRVIAAGGDGRTAPKINELQLPAETRWYSQYFTLFNLYNARTVLKVLENDAVVLQMSNKDKRARLLTLIKDEDFWGKVRGLIRVLKRPSMSIAVLEADSSRLDVVYRTFNDILTYYSEDAYILSLDDEVTYSEGRQYDIQIVLKDRLKAIAVNRWSYINTTSMSMAYLLSPQQQPHLDKMTDFEKAIGYVGAYADQLFSAAEAKRCKDELTLFLGQFDHMEEERKQMLCQMAPVPYWSAYARTRFPLLHKLAVKLYFIPTSAASSERCWSIFSLVHNKLRNRLCNKKVEMLTFIYCNSSILSVDQIDFADLVINGEDEMVLMDDIVEDLQLRGDESEDSDSDSEDDSQRPTSSNSSSSAPLRPTWSNSSSAAPLVDLSNDTESSYDSSDED